MRGVPNLGGTILRSIEETGQDHSAVISNFSQQMGRIWIRILSQKFKKKTEEKYRKNADSKTKSYKVHKKYLLIIIKFW